ncbi:MAG: aspartyl/asparaginyl beta-hydroxylase domain-containing protein, partial [Pseudomonadales bacterium]
MELNDKPTVAESTRGGDEILVLGGYRQSLAVVRALGPLDWRCVLGLPATANKSFVARSRWVSEVWRHPPLDFCVDAFLAELARFVEDRPRLKFLLPIGNRELAALNSVRHRLPSAIRCVMPNARAIEICGDKAATARMASELAVPMAPFTLVDRPEHLLDAAYRLGYPCVIRATSEANRICGMKAVIPRSARELAGFLDNAKTLQGPFIVQQYVEGDRHCLYFYASRGAVLASAEVRIDRTDRVDGTGYAVAGSSIAVTPAWQDHLLRICRHLQYDGFGGLQFIQNPLTGEQTFLEVNARLGGNHAGLERLGMHQVQWALEQQASGSPSIPSPFTYPEGLRYRWFDGDLTGFLHEWKAARLDTRAAAAWCLALPTTLLGSGHLIWDWRDPAPSLQLARKHLKPAYGKLRTATASAKKRLAANPLAAFRRRGDAWQRLMIDADAKGIERQRLSRVYDYLSIVSRVRSPRHAHPDQRPWRYFPGLTARPLHDPVAFPWRSLLEDNFACIRDEVTAARARSPFKPHHQNLADQGAWDTLYFYTGNRRIAESHALCPKISRIVRELPRAGNDAQVYLSTLSGRTHIKAHCGPTNVRLRCHFGIEVPAAARIRVGADTVPWEAGRCLFFDDS